MDIKACHKALDALLIKTFNLAFIKGMQEDDEEKLACNDTDSVRYQILGLNQKISLFMFCIDLEKIWNYAGKYFQQTYYSGILLI
jgi:hypothetical protein